jgi:maltose alpha-D-glucosyltransferase/alpha-amylase
VPTLSEAVRTEVVSLLEAYENLSRRIDELALSVPQAQKTRYHGDLHLGQVLVTADDFLIIDFEGEPGRSFEERRVKHSPLRDVAGMLRSFDYARAVGMDRALHGRPDARSTLEPAFHEWQQRSVQAFLAGYQFGLGPSAPAPSKDAGSHDLVELFQIEKALYEVRYELDNRPAWVSVPIAGILSLLRKTEASH